MELKISKYDKETDKFIEDTVKLEGIKDFKPETDWREFNAKLVDREEKVIAFKNGNKAKQFLFKDAEDERGTQLTLETWSSTDDALISQLMDEDKAVHIWYEMKKTDYGTKFNIKAIELPDGTWSVPKAKEAWKKGNAQNNRALAIQAASMLFMSGGKEQVDEVMETAQKFLDWIKADG